MFTTDYLGNELHVGDYIVYSTRWGNAVNLTLGRIVDIQPSASAPAQNTFGPLMNDRLRVKVIRYKTDHERIDRRLAPTSTGHYYGDFANPNKKVHLNRTDRAVKVEEPEWVPAFHAVNGVPA